jgi:hypothetical protein
MKKPENTNTNPPAPQQGSNPGHLSSKSLPRDPGESGVVDAPVRPEAHLIPDGQGSAEPYDPSPAPDSGKGEEIEFFSLVGFNNPECMNGVEGAFLGVRSSGALRLCSLPPSGSPGVIKPFAPEPEL